VKGDYVMFYRATKGRIFIAEVEVSGYPLCSDHLESTCACDMGSYHVCEGVECRKQCKPPCRNRDGSFLNAEECICGDTVVCPANTTCSEGSCSAVPEPSFEKDVENSTYVGIAVTPTPERHPMTPDVKWLILPAALGVAILLSYIAYRIVRHYLATTTRRAQSEFFVNQAVEAEKENADVACISMESRNSVCSMDDISFVAV